MSFWVIYWGKTQFEAKKHFSVERKNARFSVIPARTGSVVLLGHFFDGPDSSTKARRLFLAPHSSSEDIGACEVDRVVKVTRSF